MDGHRNFPSTFHRENRTIMKIDLSKHRAVVSGSTAGIGFAIATGLARAGATVVVNGRHDNRTQDAVRRIEKSVPGAKVEGIAADLGSESRIEQFLKTAGDADILVNNLGIFEPKPFVEISDADWSRFFEVNVMSGVRLSRHYLPKMLAKNWGRIVFISSESGVNIPAEMIQYGVTKTAQLALSRGLAEITAGTNVTVNSVLPGPTRSEGVEDFVKDMARTRGVSEEDIERDFFKEIRPSSLLKRFATVEEVANMVIYVVSEQASATNGAALRVDGGVVRSIV
jgi:NAD(P)-dependent dehydrogenase (short-subunit alcohol dehydrogenase family)